MLDNEITFHIQGEAGLFLYEQRIIFNNLKLVIGIDLNKLEFIHLILDLSSIDLSLLTEYFDALNYYNPETPVYKFSMKNESINEYSPEFINLSDTDISEYLKIGDGLCFKLENYYCIGIEDKDILK